jgi:hypothetical protein
MLEVLGGSDRYEFDYIEMATSNISEDQTP